MDEVNQNEQLEQVGSGEGAGTEQVDYIVSGRNRYESPVTGIYIELLQQRFWGREANIVERIALYDEAEEIAASRDPIFADLLAARRSDPERMEKRKRWREELIASGGEPTEERKKIYREIEEMTKALMATEKRTAAEESAAQNEESGAEPIDSKPDKQE